MTRVSPRLLLALGAVLFAAWLVVPASTSPSSQSATVLAVPVAPLPPATPEVQAIDREVDRLSDWLAAPAPEAGAVRDPFQFVESADARVGAAADAPGYGVVVEPAAPVTAWPALVAILASGSGTEAVRRAVFEDVSGLVQIRAAGESLGDIVVTGVTDDGATLMHTPSGESIPVLLR